jgi:hypothetical protein
MAPRLLLRPVMISISFNARGWRGQMTGAVCLGLLLQVVTVCAQIDPGSSTTAWVAVQFGLNSNPDAASDQQTGNAEADIVGNATHPSLYMQYYSAGASSALGFRLRLGADANPTGFKGAAFIGLDANTDGILDLFLGVNNQGSGDKIAIWNPGTGLNTSPSTTTLVSVPLNSYTQTSLNYRFQAVTALTAPSALSYDLNADSNADQFLSFVLPFSDIAAALANRGIFGFSASSPMQLVAATATQANSLNEDLNGVAGGINSTLSWDQLGASSLPYAPNGVTPIPEPSSVFLCSAAGVLILFRISRNRRRAQSR